MARSCARGWWTMQQLLNNFRGCKY